jgi:hypothetical protein
LLGAISSVSTPTNSSGPKILVARKNTPKHSSSNYFKPFFGTKNFLGTEDFLNNETGLPGKGADVSWEISV